MSSPLTPPWREPNSNHRFRLRYSPSGSSLVVSADLSTLPSRKRSSQRTQRRREPNSNHRFHLRYSPWGSSLVVSADLSTLPSRKRSSQRTQRWRELDSNPRSPTLTRIFRNAGTDPTRRRGAETFARNR